MEQQIDAARAVLNPSTPEHRAALWEAALREMEERRDELIAACVTLKRLLETERKLAGLTPDGERIEQPLPLPPSSVSAQVVKCCNAPAPDRSWRVCDKPEGHDGDHWTYGGNELTWAEASPSVSAQGEEEQTK